MMVRGDHWWSVVVRGQWWSVVVSDGQRWSLMVSGGQWSMMVSSGQWWAVVVSHGQWWSMVFNDGQWWSVMVSSGLVIFSGHCSMVVIPVTWQPTEPINYATSIQSSTNNRLTESCCLLGNPSSWFIPPWVDRTILMVSIEPVIARQVDLLSARR